MPPPKTVRELGLAERPKSVTTSVTLSTELAPLDVPVTVSELVAAGVALLVVTVIVVLAAVLAETVTDGGAKLAVAPVGRPVTLKLTVPEKPLTGVTVTV
jgi:hypothetical protein